MIPIFGNLAKPVTRNSTKASLSVLAAGALAVGSANPAVARDRGDDGIGAGEIIAGAVILGGLAAILSSDNDRDDYRDRDRYRDRNYRPRYDRRRGNGQRAIERCVRAVENDARRAGYRFADVTEINDVDRERRGWEIEGRLVVEGQRYRGGRYGDRYNNRYNRRGYARNGDRGKFSCEIRRGRIVDLDYSGIRGL